MERQFRKYDADDNLIVRGSTRMYNSIATQYTYLSFLLSYLKIIEECYVNALVLE